MGYKADRVREDDKRILSQFSFQVGPTATAHTFTAAGYLVLRNQGSENVHFNFTAGTATTDDFVLKTGDAVDTEAYIRVNEAIAFVSAAGTQTVAGWIYDYIS